MTGRKHLWCLGVTDALGRREARGDLHLRRRLWLAYRRQCLHRVTSQQVPFSRDPRCQSVRAGMVGETFWQGGWDGGRVRVCDGKALVLCIFLKLMPM